ncbi:MAG: AAA family ATPase, partial [Rubripirellula sp.]
ARPTNLVSSETPIILSEIIVNPVLARPEIQALPNFRDGASRERYLRENLALKGGGTSGRLTITFTDTDASSTSTVCNAVADEYMEYRREYEQQQADMILRSLRPELKKWEDLVKERKETVENLTLAAISAGEIAESVTEGRFSFIADLRKRINDLMLEQVGLEAKIKRVNADWPANRSEIESAVQNDPEVQDLRALIDSYRGVVRGIKVAGMESVKRDELATLQQQILDATSDLDAAEEVAGTNLLDQWASNVTQGLERELYISRFELEMLQSVFEDEKARFLKAGDQSLKLRFAEDDLASAQGLLDGLRQRSTSIEMESRYAAPVISLRRATKPEYPVDPVFATKSNAMLLLGLCCLPFGLAAGLEFKLNRFTTVKAIATRVELPILGEIAAISDLVELEAAKDTQKAKRYRSYTYAGDIHRQSVDNLRIRLTLGDQLRLGKVTSVLSSFEGEAKTTLSKDLAHCISESHSQKTLLIDMDLRCPDQHRIWGLKNRMGVCETLRGDIPFHKAVKRIDSSLHVMPAGKNQQMHLSSVISKRVDELFQWARTQYDYIIVDTAPLNYASESLVIAKHSDTAVLSLLRDVSRLEPTRNTVQNLNSVGVPLLGCVLSGITPLQYQYRYGNYYYYRGTYYSKNAEDVKT